MASGKTTIASGKRTTASRKRTIASEKTTIVSGKTTIASGKTTIVSSKTTIVSSKTTIASRKTTVTNNRKYEKIKKVFVVVINVVFCASLCVTRQECTAFFMSTGYILEEINECVLFCPSGFIYIPDSRFIRCKSSPENNYCNGACREKHIHSIEDFQLLKYCSRVHTLNIYNIATVESRGNNFYEAFTVFNSLEQIDHEFTIHNVKVFSTLSIFSRLHRIDIITNATLTIEENEFLTELWANTYLPSIIQGSLNIVRNLRLCLKSIADFISFTTTHEKELQVKPNTWNEYTHGYLALYESKFLTITIDRKRY
ncbi:unnamed protein product [Rotaria sp. Silwood2]|nr:unnamed protein product [Rotaria sp. Silwood2]